MINEKYTENNLRQSIKTLTGKDDLSSLARSDVPLIKKLLVDYIVNASDEYIKQVIIQEIVSPLKIKGLNEFLFKEYENGKGELYRWYVVNAIINDLDVTPVNIARVNHYISERNTSDIGRFLYWIGKHKIKTSLPYVERLLSSQQDSVIATVIETLGLIGNKDTLKFIEPYLKSRNSIIKSMAKKAIANLSKKGDFPQQIPTKLITPLVNWLDVPTIEKILKNQETVALPEYSIEFDSEKLSEVWKLLGETVPVLSGLGIDDIQVEFEKIATGNAVVAEVKCTANNETILVFVCRVDFDVARLIFISRNKAWINKIEKVSDKYLDDL